VITWPRHIPAAEVTPQTVQAALDRAVQMAESPALETVEAAR